MNRNAYKTIIAFIAGTIFGVVLMIQIPAMLRAQWDGELPPDEWPTAFKKTSRQLDVAINGRGYFQFNALNGSTIYSRESSLYLNVHNHVVGRDGLLIAPAITVPEDVELTAISEEGIVSAYFPNEKKVKQIGRFELVVFPNSEKLKSSLQEGYYEECEASGAPIWGRPGQSGSGTLLQGYKLLPFIPVNHPKHLVINP